MPSPTDPDTESKKRHAALVSLRIKAAKDLAWAEEVFKKPDPPLWFYGLGGQLVKF